MNLEAVLQSKIKPELNAIYTEPPFMMEGGWDCGWFCREHALHTYVLAAMLHQPASIKIGDFLIHSEIGTGITSINSGSDHAWCEIDGVQPVDVSMTFVHFKGRFPHLPIVYGTKAAGSERQTIKPDVKELLEFPYQFLYAPPAGLKKWTEIHGSEIFSKTTAHLYRLAKGHLKPLCRSRSTKQIIKFIKSHYLNATSEILSTIGVTDRSGELA